MKTFYHVICFASTGVKNETPAPEALVEVAKPGTDTWEVRFISHTVAPSNMISKELKTQFIIWNIKY